MKSSFIKCIFLLGIGLFLFPQTGWADYVTKNLYFHLDSGDSDADEDMSRTVPTGGSPSTVTIGDGGSDEWIEYTAHAGNLSLKGTSTVVITISNVVGSPDITAELGYYAGGRSGSYTAIKNKKINNCVNGTVSFTLSLSPTTVLAGDPIAVRISEQSGGGDSFDVEFDSSTRQSRVELRSESHIAFALLNTYVGAFTNTALETVYDSGDTSYIRAYVEDPFGYSDISSTTLVVTDSDGSTVFNTTLTALSSFGVRNIYEHNYSTGTPLGQYDYTLTSNEGSEGTVSAVGSGAFYVYNKILVELSDLRGEGYDKQVVIFWETSMELDNLGFNVYRSLSSSEGYEKINPVLISGLGDSAKGGKYLFIDNTVENGTGYYYKVEDVENDGDTTLHGPVRVVPRQMTDQFQYNGEDYISIGSTEDYTEDSSQDDPAEEYSAEELETQTGLTIYSTEEDGTIIRIVPPDYQIVEVSDANGIYHEIRMDDYGLTDTEGYPRLPSRGFILEIPSEGEVSLEILDIQIAGQVEKELSPYETKTDYREETARILEDFLMNDQEISDILTAEEKKLLKKSREARKARKGTRHRKAENNQSIFYPTETLLVERVFSDHGIPTLILRFYPVQVRKVDQVWTIQSVESIKVRITVTEKESSTSEEVENILATQFRLAAEGALKISVAEDGIKRLSYEELKQVGFDMGKDPRKAALFVEGKEVSLHIEGEEDGKWDTGDFLEFYGVGNKLRYSNTRYYWLMYQEEDGSRITNVASGKKGDVAAFDFMDIIYREENKYYYMTLPDGEGKDHWFWDFVLSGQKKDFPFDLKYASFDGDKGWIMVNIQALTSDKDINPDHHTRIYLNDTLIGDFLWDGPHDYLSLIEVDQTLFNEGENILSVEEVGDTAKYDYIYFNSFFVAYYREYVAWENRLFFSTSEEGWVNLRGFDDEEIVLYDITQPDSPQRLVGTKTQLWGNQYSLSFKAEDGFRYYAAVGKSHIEHPFFVEMDTPSNLNSSINGADYIIITHADFLSTVQQLADYRAESGMRVVVANVDEIYDEFSFGNFDPEAIRSFLSHAWNHWPEPSPSNVLLVGGGTYDFKGYLGFEHANYIPPYLIDTGSIQTASDNRYVSVEGDDNLPEMSVGRLPVWDTAILERIIGRIIQYETEPSADGMKNRICFVADNSDGGGDFEKDIEELAESLIPSGVLVTQVHLSELGVDNTRREILNQFEAGNLIIHYQGHGAINLWASENIFNGRSAAYLDNAPNYPFVESMSCFTGFFFNPYTNSLAEELLYSESGGAIAVWASTGYAQNEAMKSLADGFLNEIYTNDNRQIGSAIIRAKLNLLEHGPYYEEIDSFTLFGDPALQLK